MWVDVKYLSLIIDEPNFILVTDIFFFNKYVLSSLHFGLIRDILKTKQKLMWS